MKSNLSLTLLGVALLAAPAVFGQATSGVVGFSSLTVQPGGAVIVPSLVNSSVYQGQAVISGTSVTPVSAPGWTVGAYNATAFTGQTPNYPTHYVEIVAGANEGLILDIASNSASALTTSQAGPSGTFQIAIRAHVTLNKVSDGATGLSQFDDIATVFASTGVPTDRVYVGGADGWQTTNGRPAGHTVIYPGSGFAFTATNVVTLTMMGEVKPTKTQVPLYPTSPNIVGPLNPAANTLLSASGLTSAVQAFDDTITVFSTDGAMTQLPYTTDGVQVLRSNGSPVNSTDIIGLNRGIAIGVQSPVTWIVNSPLAP